ncbi:MAG: hypothetical protein WB795_10070 [Candidatus Acidiferrales bacterium]
MADVSARHLGIPALFIFLAGSVIQQQPAPVSTPAAVPASAPVPAAPLARYTLVEQVQFPLGVATADHAPGLALCPDGTLYAGIHGSGLKAFDATGKLLLTDSTIPLPRYPETYACDAQRHLYTTERKLSIYEVTADGKLKQDSSSSMRAVLKRVLITPDGTIYGLSLDPKDRLSLIIIGKDGKILHSFGDQASVRSTGFANRAGILVWDAANKRIVYDAPGGLDLRFFDTSGKELNLKTTRKTDRAPGPRPRLEASPALHNLVSLPNSQLVAEEITNSNKFNQFYTNLRIYDAATLNPVSELIATNKVGSLIGATQDGSLYFLRTQAGGKISVVRASLQPVVKK